MFGSARSAFFVVDDMVLDNHAKEIRFKLSTQNEVIKEDRKYRIR